MTRQNQAEIISIGTELLMGEITDTNARFLASQLRLLGIEAGRITTAGDDKAQLCEVVRQALARTDLILTSGGLGPTDMDITRECVAEVLGEQPVVDARLEQELRAWFTRTGREMPPQNLKQVMVIPSAQGIPNPNGTAPGWWVEKAGKIIVLLPGPPREMEPMWHHEIKPRLQAKFPDRVVLTRTLKVFGLGEGKVNEMIVPFFHLDNPSLGIYARPDGIHLRLIARGENAAELLDTTEQQLRNILTDHIWGRDEDTLPVIIGRLLSEKGLRLATFDDGTRGTVSSLINEVDGATRYYPGGLVAVADEAKIRWGVPQALLVKHGAISAEVAEAMAVIAREKFAADIGLSITGIVGLDGAGKTPGLAYIGLADAKGKTSWLQSNLPHRDVVRHRAAMAALFRLRQRLLDINSKS